MIPSSSNSPSQIEHPQGDSNLSPNLTSINWQLEETNKKIHDLIDLQGASNDICFRGINMLLYGQRAVHDQTQQISSLHVHTHHIIAQQNSMIEIVRHSVLNQQVHFEEMKAIRENQARIMSLLQSLHEKENKESTRAGEGVRDHQKKSERTKRS